MQMSTSSSLYTAPPASQPQTRLRWGLIALLVAAAFLLAGWLFFGMFFLFQTAGPIAPNVLVGDLNVGGMDADAAADLINQHYNQNRALLAGDGSRYWEVNSLEFGLWVDPAASARAAYDYGRGENHWAELFTSLTSAANPPSVAPAAVFNPQTAADRLAKLAASVYIAPEPAQLSYSSGQWSVVPGASGLELDIETTLRQMAENPSLILMTRYLPLSTRPAPSATADLAAQLSQVSSQLTAPLLVQAYDPISNETIEWSVPPEMLAGWIRLTQPDGQIQLSLDESGFPAYLASLEAEVTPARSFAPLDAPYSLTERWYNHQPVTVLLRHAPTTYTVQPGDTLLKIAYRTGIPFWMIVKANPGINPDAVPVGQTLNIPSKDDLLPLPVVLGKRVVISITDQHMWVYENGNLIRDFVISTGIDRSPTQPGVFQVQTHDVEAYASVWDLYMPHFLGIYEAWPGFMNGIHGLPTLSSGRRLWKEILGKPASYGCIILDLEPAEWLFNWAEAGVVVEIKP